jgi:carbon storage regulator
MLVLTRRNNEAIMLGDEVRITILEVDGDRVKIGIDAPQAMKVLRAELLSEIRDVNREAIRADIDFMQNIVKND